MDSGEDNRKDQNSNSPHQDILSYNGLSNLSQESHNLPFEIDSSILNAMRPSSDPKLITNTNPTTTADIDIAPSHDPTSVSNVHTGTPSNFNTTSNPQSIDTLWKQYFNAPMAMDKEKRIQQAVDFMEKENQLHLMDKEIVKHSFRQIAQFFKVPKSTLYDRARSNKQNGKNQDLSTTVSHETSSLMADMNHDIDVGLDTPETHSFVTIEPESLRSASSQNRVTPRRKSILPTVSMSATDRTADLPMNRAKRKLDTPSESRYKRYEVQMKLSVNKEFQLLDEIRDISHAYGCVISKNQMEDYIKSHIDNKVELGKTWLRSFLNRHKDHIIYGNETCFNTIPIELIKEVKGNYECLTKCIVDDVHMKLHNPKYEVQHVFIISYLKLNNFGVNKNSITICLDVSLQDGSVKFVMPSRLLLYTNQNKSFENDDAYEDQWSINENYNGQKYRIINKGIREMINECVRRQELEDSRVKKPLILFEGFTEAFHWDVPLCEEVLKISNFISLPWNEHLFRDTLFQHLHQKLFQAMENITVVSDSKGHEFNIALEDDQELSHDLFKIFDDTFLKDQENEPENESLGSESSNREKNNGATVDTKQGEEYNNTMPKELDNSPDVSVSQGTNEAIEGGSIPEHNHLTNELGYSLGNTSPIPGSATLNFHGRSNSHHSTSDSLTTESWNDVMALINDNELHLYNCLTYPGDKELLKKIFDKIRKFPPPQSRTQ